MSNFSRNRPTVTDLHRRIMGEEQAVFHTHAYAHVAGGRFGATDPGSYTRRRELERNRQTIGSYRNATISSTPRQYNGQVGMNGSRGSLPSASPRNSFREPPARTYDPYR